MQKIHRLTSFFTALGYSCELKTPQGFLPSFYYPQSPKKFDEIMQFVADHSLEDTWIKNVSDMYIRNQILEYGSARLEIYKAFESLEDDDLAYSKLTRYGKRIGKLVYTAHQPCFDRFEAALWALLKEPSGQQKFGIVFLR